MNSIIYGLAFIGSIAIVVTAICEVKWWWKARKWKPTPFLMPCGMPEESKRTPQDSAP